MRNIFYLFCVIGLLVSCNSRDSKKYVWHSREVTATAYNSLAYQTSEQPSITAFGDSLKPGMKCIAVSRDLLSQGLAIYLVKDKMNKRWQNRIDIYMDNDVKAAREWGRKKVTIKYRLEVKDSI